MGIKIISNRCLTSKSQNPYTLDGLSESLNCADVDGVSLNVRLNYQNKIILYDDDVLPNNKVIQYYQKHKIYVKYPEEVQKKHLDFFGIKRFHYFLGKISAYNRTHPKTMKDLYINILSFKNGDGKYFKKMGIQFGQKIKKYIHSFAIMKDHIYIGSYFPWILVNIIPNIKKYYLDRFLKFGLYTQGNDFEEVNAIVKKYGLQYIFCNWKGKQREKITRMACELDIGFFIENFEEYNVNLLEIFFKLNGVQTSKPEIIRNKLRNYNTWANANDNLSYLTMNLRSPV